MDGLPPEKTRELLESLECPVCKEICPPPLYNCVNGHMVCGKCSKQLKKCSICSGKMTGTRNRIAEGITALLQLKCTNNGCGKCFKGDLFKAHVAEECNFRPVACYCQKNKNCDGKVVELSKYEQHLLQEHKIHGSDTKNLSIELSTADKIWKKYHRMYYTKYDGHLFLVNHRMDQNNYYSWVTIVGSDSEEEAQKYEVSLSYFSSIPTKPKCDFQQIGVHSFRKTFESIQTSGQFAGLPIGWLDRLAEKSENHDPKTIKIDNGWSIKVRITRKKESA